MSQLHANLFSPIFELEQQSSSQKVSPGSGECIGAHQMCARAFARDARQRFFKIQHFHFFGSFSKISKIFKKKNQFFSTKIRFLTRFHQILFSPIFKLEQQSSNQKISPGSGEYIGAHQMFTRALARALRAKEKMHFLENSKFSTFLAHSASARRARKCARAPKNKIFEFSGSRRTNIQLDTFSYL